MIADKKKIYPFLYSLLALCISIWLVPLYTSGDQYHYNLFFENCILSNYSLADKYSCYSNYLDSREPGYFTIMNILGSVLNKNTIIILSNVLLTYLITRLIFLNMKVGIQRHFLSFFLVSNFYVLVLFLSAERLKFSFLFLLLALLIQSRKLKIIFIFSALMTHSQNLILFITAILTQLKSLSIALWKKIVLLIGSAIILATVILLNKEHILRKISVYSAIDGDVGLNALAKVSVLYLLAVISIRKMSVVLGGLPILAASYFLGSNRIMILMFIFYIIVMIKEKGRMDFFMFLVLSYFSYKSIGFIQNILIYGEGFNVH